MQSVSVYLREGMYFIVVIHGSGGGDPCIESGPVTVLDGQSAPEALGSAVLGALDHSSNNAPWPTDWKKVIEPLCTAARVKTWATFAKRASNARVDRSGHLITVLPSRRTPKNAFEARPEPPHQFPYPDPASIGAALATMLRVS